MEMSVVNFLCLLLLTGTVLLYKVLKNVNFPNCMVLKNVKIIENKVLKNVYFIVNRVYLW
jgi:hypothetical protein